MRGDTHGANDSFYVVPTSGHTLSYANILSFEQKEKRRTAASHTGDRAEATDEADLDDFVDAAESQAAMSPELKKRMGSARSEKHLQNVVEELYLENKSLKEMLDKLSRRLHAFELNSQSSHLALAQSLRLQRPGSPTSSSGGAGAGAGSEELLRKRNQELEAQLAEAIRRLESLEKDHRKLQETVEKYRDRWEKLKAGAKARREAQGSADHGEAAKPSR
ncbi:hypothetical protein VTK73DRAFT_8531 [Phialemonium thermophilum]|uniref:Uncharacterized protein n=1 Tax=Phialemonium thermophilum TaxID=223376 RepID=A0ABR3W899_9PEZI